MLPRIHKNKILLVSGVGDTFFSTKSRKQLTYGFELGEKITKHVATNVEEYYGVINLTTPTEYWAEVKPFTPVQDTRLINVVLNSNKFLDVSNEISIKDSESNKPLLFNGNDLDFLLPSKDFEIHIVGVDMNGIYQDIIKTLLEKSYKVFLYSDMIKRYRETEPFIRSIRNKDFEYCSSKLALA